MIKKMARVQFIGMCSMLSEMIELLQHLGIVELDDISQQPELGLSSYTISETDQKQKADLELSLASVDGLLERFRSLKPKKEMPVKAEKLVDPKAADAKLVEINAEVQALLGKKSARRDDLTLLSRYREIVESLSEQLPLSASDPANTIFAGIINSNRVTELSALESGLKRLPHAGQITSVRLPLNPGLMIFSVTCPLDRQKEVEAILQAEKFFEITLPGKFSVRQPQEALHEISTAMITYKNDLSEIDTQMRELAVRWLLTLKSIRIIFLNKIEAINAMTLAGITEDTFHLIGWCLQEDTAKLEQAILKNLQGLVSVLWVAIPPSQANRIPVATSTSEFLQPYKEIVDVRSIPNYKDVDPTGLMAFFLPLFFGFMVSDIGYGILIYLFSRLVKKVKISGLIGSLLKTFQIGALWSIVFGFVFGEIFGNLGAMMGLRPILFSREDPTKTTILMEIAIGIGAIHIMFGLLIGIWNGLRHHEFKHVLENAGTFVALVGLILLGGAIAGIFSPLFNIIGASLMAIGLIGVASTMGLTGIFLAPIEFIGVLGSILSYLRLAALGLASVFLAEVANELGGKFGGVVIGTIVAVVIHAFNLIMAMFSPTIQSMRLQFVEFFRRFYTGGGRQFKPFKVQQLD